MPTIKELKTLAKDLGLRGYSRMKKQELINLLNSHNHVVSTSRRPRRSTSRRPRRPRRSTSRRPRRSSSRRPRRSTSRKTTNNVTLKSLRVKAKRLGIKGYSKLKKAELERLITSTKTVAKTPELECTQMMEATEFVELASDIPKNLKVKFRLSPTVVHCYNIVGLRSWMLAGNSQDPMTRIKFNDKQIKQVKEQWKKLKKAKSEILLQQLKDDMVINADSNIIPDWEPKKKKCNYVFMISIATPHRFFSAIHIIPKNKWNSVKNLNNGIHTSQSNFQKITRTAKWSLEIPAASDMAVTGGVQYPNNNGIMGLLDSGSDGAAILASFQKLWEANKLLTTKKFVNGRRTNIDDGKFKLNMPGFAKILDKSISGTVRTNNNTYMVNPSYKNMMNPNYSATEVLNIGGDLLDVGFWDRVRGGQPEHVRNPGSLFYNYWLALGEQLNELEYNETSQY